MFRAAGRSVVSGRGCRRTNGQGRWITPARGSWVKRYSPSSLGFDNQEAVGTLKQGQYNQCYRSFSSNLGELLQREITEESEAPDFSSAQNDVLAELGFKFLQDECKNSAFVIQNEAGNTTVSFDAQDFTFSEAEQERGVTFEAVIANNSKELVFDCSVIGYTGAAEEDQDSDGVDAGDLVIDSIIVRDADTGDDEEAYTPTFEDLDEELKVSFYEYLNEHGVSSDLAMAVLDIAETREQKDYLEWLNAVHSLVKK